MIMMMVVTIATRHLLSMMATAMAMDGTSEKAMSITRPRLVIATDDYCN